MKLSISHIAWSAEHDAEMYKFLGHHHFTGLEIAPTRIFPQSPYDRLDEAAEYSRMLNDIYGLTISSIQSIWYGRSESIFGSDEDRRFLVAYTKQAIQFAEAINCCNMVFGCPRNRNIPGPEYRPIAIDFFREIGAYAAEHGTVLAIEPNPPYYNTNFINTTADALDICREIGSDGIKVNVDLGTSINYGEDLDFINENIGLVNHIHISEPLLAAVLKRDIHRELRKLNYGRWFSVEMKNTGDIDAVKSIIAYVEGVMT